MKARAKYERTHTSFSPIGIAPANSATEILEIESIKPGDVGEDELRTLVGAELTKRWEVLLENMRVDSGKVDTRLILIRICSTYTVSQFRS